MTRFFLKNDSNIEELLKDFVLYCEAKNISKNTIKTYKGQVKHFVTRYKDQKLETIDKDTIIDYIIYLKERNISDTSIKSYISSLRTLLYYGMNENRIKPFDISLPRAEKKPKEIYSIEELERLLKKPPIRKESFSDYRMWVLCNYLLATGNRISTALNIKVEDINFQEQTILLRKNKDKQTHIIPLTKKMLFILREYIRYRGTKGYLFCNNSNGKWDLRACQTNQKAYNLKRGVTKHGFHRFRHTFAKMWIMNGGDIFRLQKMLGHKDLTMVKEYVNMFDKDIVDGLEEVNPLNFIQTKIKPLK